MDNAIYVALSRQTTLFDKLEMNANNLANANTSGYQSQGMQFTDYVVPGGGDHKKFRVAYTQDEATYRNTTPGPIRTTGNPLDVAIQGKGFLRVETPGGERYTRAGSMAIDANGVLVSPEGYPMLDQDGARIVFEPDDKEIKIRGDGTIVTDAGERARLGVVQFANEQLLKHTAGSLYRSEAPGQPPTEEYGVVQGAVEGSNVQSIMELTDLVTLQRGMSNTTKFIESVNDLERKAIQAYSKPGNA